MPLAASIALSMTGLGPASSAPNDPIRCAGRRATIVGTDGADVIKGTPGDDVIQALRGPDQVQGRQGDDVICGGRGDDLVYGQSEDDRLVDTFWRGERSPAQQHGGPGDDVLRGSLMGGRAFGGPGKDVITSYQAVDGRGDDEVVARFVEAGPGDDTFTAPGRLWSALDYYRSPSSIVVHGRSLVVGNGRDEIEGFSQIHGSDRDDRFYGTGRKDIYWGNAGDDVLFGRDGFDALYGDLGDDELHGESGHDKLSGGGGNDRLRAGTGNDQAYSGDGSDTIWGGDHHDWLSSSADEATIYGGAGDDVLDGGRFLEEFHGNAGNDFLRPGPDNDIVGGGDGLDVVVFRSPVNAPGDPAVVASLLTGTSTGEQAGTDTLDGIEAMDGTDAGDTLEGDNSPNVLHARASGSEEDHLIGHGGDDLFAFSSESEWPAVLDEPRIDDGDGSDWLSYEDYGRKVSQVSAGPTENLIAGPRTHDLRGADITVGSLGDDSLYGDEGENILVGRTGSDSCYDGERIDSCEQADGGTPYYQATDEPPQVCDALADVYLLGNFTWLTGLRDFCAGFEA